MERTFRLPVLVNVPRIPDEILQKQNSSNKEDLIAAKDFYTLLIEDSIFVDILPELLYSRSQISYKLARLFNLRKEAELAHKDVSFCVRQRKLKYVILKAAIEEFLGKTEEAKVTLIKGKTVFRKNDNYLIPWMKKLVYFIQLCGPEKELLDAISVFRKDDVLTTLYLRLVKETDWDFLKCLMDEEKLLNLRFFVIAKDLHLFFVEISVSNQFSGINPRTQSNLICDIFENGASFRKAELVLKMPLLHFSLQLSLHEGDNAVLRLVLREYATTSKMRKETNSDHETALDILRKSRDTCTENQRAALEILLLEYEDKTTLGDDNTTETNVESTSLPRILDEVVTCLRNGNYGKAITAYELAEKKYRTIDLRHVASAAAVSYKEKKEYWKAINTARMHIRHKRDETEMHELMAFCYEKLNNYDRAINEYVLAFNMTFLRQSETIQTEERHILMRKMSMALSKEENSQEQNLHNRMEESTVDLWIDTTYFLILEGNWDGASGAFRQLQKFIYTSKPQLPHRQHKLRPFYDIDKLEKRDNYWITKFINILIKCGSDVSTLTEGLHYPFIHAYVRIVILTGVDDHLEEFLTRCDPSSIQELDSKGNTPLHTAFKEWKKLERPKKFMEVLTKFGLNPEQRNQSGKDAKSYLPQHVRSKLATIKSAKPMDPRRKSHEEHLGGTLLYARKHTSWLGRENLKSTRKQPGEYTCAKCQSAFNKSEQLKQQKDEEGALSNLVYILEQNCKKEGHKPVKLDIIKCLVDHIALNEMTFFLKYIDKIKPHIMEKLVKELKDRRMWFHVMHVINYYNDINHGKGAFLTHFKMDITDVLREMKNEKEEDVKDLIVFMLDNGATLTKDGRAEIKLVMEAGMYSVFVALIRKGQKEMFFTALSLALENDSECLTTLNALLKAKEWPDDLRNGKGETVFHIICKQKCSERMINLFLEHGFNPNLKDSEGKHPEEYLGTKDTRKGYFRAKRLSQNSSRTIEENSRHDVKNETTDANQKSPEPCISARVLTIEDIERELPNTIEELQQDLCKIVKELPQKKSKAVDSNYEDKDNIPKVLNEEVEEDDQVHQSEENEYDYDLLDWDVECTASVWKMLVYDRKFQYHLKRKVLDIINKLASGEFEHGKKLKNNKTLSLYESKLDEGARIIWEKTKAFSPKKTKHLISVPNSCGIMNVYCEIIRIWDIVIDHGNLSKSIDNIVEKITKSSEKGEECNFKKRLKLDERFQSKKISDQVDSRMFVRIRTPRLYIEAEEDLKDETNFIFPPVSPDEKEFSIFKFYHFSTSLANNILKKVSVAIDFPFKETPHEFSVINLPSTSPILLLGRSGTGKTTCCLYRLWNELCFHLSRNEQNRGYAAQDEHKDDMGETVEDLEFNQIFVTKNNILCTEVEKSFKEFCRAEPMTMNLSKGTSSNLPNSLMDVRKEQFPLFLTSRQLLLLLDASLGPDYFFERDDSGSPTANIEGWSVSDRTTVIDLTKEEDIDDDLEIFSDEDDTEDEDFPDLQDYLKTRRKKHGNSYRKKERRDKKSAPDRREVTYGVFQSEIWPRIMIKKDKTHPSAIWTEFVSFIKGSFESLCTSKGYLSEEEYLAIGRKQAPNFLENREKIYDYFLKYELYKKREGMFDELDVVRNILRRYCEKKNKVDWSIHQFYVDETQDFTQAELWLFLILLEDPNQIFLTGDTAQGIMHGISFRFEDLKTLFYKLSQNCKRENSVVQVEVPKLLTLPHNYRSHNGIIMLASSVLDILERYFPASFDKVEECGMLPGLKPVLIESRSPSDLFSLLRGAVRKTTSPIEFGAHQAILVHDDIARDAVPKELQDSLILTIFESKGLEFDDILLYNFFKDSQVNHEWKLATTYQKECSQRRDESRSTQSTGKEEEGNNPRGIKHGKRGIREEVAKETKVLQTELKQLYTAITRARVNVWIYDENEEKREPMFSYFKERDLVRNLRLNVKEQGTEKSFPGESSKEEWMLRGQELLQIGLYELATKCFLKGGNEYKAKTTRALSYASNAKKQSDLPERKVHYLKAAHIFLNNKLQRKAMKCLLCAKEYQILAQLYEKSRRFLKAGHMYLTLGQTEDFIRNYQNAWRFRDAVRILKNRNLYTQAKDVLRKYKMCIKEYNGNIPKELTENAPDIDIERLSYSEADHWCRKGNDKAMMNALNDIKNVDDVIEFLSKRNKLLETVTILEKRGFPKKIVHEYLKHGKTEAAICKCKELHDMELLGRCYIIDSTIKMEKGVENIQDMYPHLQENLQNAFDILTQKNKSLAGKAAFLLGQLTKNPWWIEKSIEEYENAIPVKDKAGIMECMEWILSNVDISIPHNIGKVIPGLETSLDTLVILKSTRNQEGLNKIYNHFGLYGRTGTLEYYPLQNPKFLRCIGKKPKENEMSISQKYARENIYNFLANKTKTFHKEIYVALMSIREKLLLCNAVQRQSPYRDSSREMRTDVCYRIHSKCSSRDQFIDLIYTDLLLFQLGYVLYSGSKKLQDKSSCVMHLKFDIEYKESFHTFMSYLLGDLISSLQFCSGDQSLITFFRSALRNSPNVRLIRDGIRTFFSKSDIPPASKKINSTIYFMNIYFLYYIVEDLFTDLSHPCEMLKCYEDSIRGLCQNMKTEKAKREMISFGFEFSTQKDTTDVNYKGLLVGYFYRAMSHLYDKEDAVMAFIEFTKFVRIEGRNMSFDKLPDFSDLLLFFEYFTTFIVFAISKHCLVKKDAACKVFLPMAYITNIDTLNALLCQHPRGRYRLEQLVDESNIKEIEKINECFGFIVDFMCAKGKGFLQFLLDKEDSSNILMLLSRCIILLGTWMCNVRHSLPINTEIKILNALRCLKYPHDMPSLIQKTTEKMKIATCQKDIGISLREYLTLNETDRLVVCEWDKKLGTVKRTETIEIYLTETPFPVNDDLTIPEMTDKSSLSHAYEKDLQESLQQVPENNNPQSNMKVDIVGRKLLFMLRIKHPKLSIQRQWKKEQTDWFQEMFSDIKINEEFCGICGVKFEVSMSNSSTDAHLDQSTVHDTQEQKPLHEKDIHISTKKHSDKFVEFSGFIEQFKRMIFDRYFEAHFSSDNYLTPDNEYLNSELGLEISRFRRHKRDADMLMSSIIEHRSWSRYSCLQNAVHKLSAAEKEMKTKVREAMKMKKKEAKIKKIKKESEVMFTEEDFPSLPPVVTYAANPKRIKRKTGVKYQDRERHLEEFLRCHENQLHRLFLGQDGNDRLHICAVFEDKVKDVPKTYKDIPVRSKLRSDNNYLALKAMYGQSGTIPDDDRIEMEKLLRLHSDALMASHSNLEIFTISPSKFKDDTEEFSEEPCFVMYCTFKGMIPVKEKPFPKKLGKYAVDVREGMFYLLPGNGDSIFPSSVSYFQHIQMGCNIGAKNGNKTGTLGGFVNCPQNGLCFLTCAHVLHDITVTNPSLPNSFSLTPLVSVLQPGPSQTTAEECGKEIKNFFGTTSSGVTIDAALVKVDPKRMPDRGNFAGLTVDDLESLGFNAHASPEYVTGEIKTVLCEEDRFQPLIKCGTNTGITRGTLRVKGTAVRLSDFTISLNTQKTNVFLAKQQYEIIPQAGKPFANTGDSGSFVFLLDKAENLHCIGMLIGVTNMFTGIVTPIGDILDTFGIPHQNMYTSGCDDMQE